MRKEVHVYPSEDKRGSPFVMRKELARIQEPKINGTNCGPNF